MFNSHLFKVIIGFCGMIAVGLAVLFFMGDSTKTNPNTGTLSQSKTVNNTKPQSGNVTLPPINKSTTSKKVVK